MRSKRVYISADYSPSNGDTEVVDELHIWGSDNKHKVDYVDTANVVNSVSRSPDCRPCDLKKEFNKQINGSDAAIFIIGDKTSSRIAGCSCKRMAEGKSCSCTPYKQNVNGALKCKVIGDIYIPGPVEDVGEINPYSYLEHEFLQAQKKNKSIIIVYNSLYKQPSWLPDYMREYEDRAQPFWIKNTFGQKIGNYQHIKESLGYE